MKTVVYRALPVRRPKAVALARAASEIPAYALAIAGALLVMMHLALRGLY